MPHLVRMEQHDLSIGYLSKRKAAVYADVSPRTLDYAVARGELKAFRLLLSGATGKSRKLLFRKADIDAWIARFEVNLNLDQIVDSTVAEVLANE